MGKAKAPPQPNYGQITRDTLQAQVDLAPQLYNVSAQYEPKYVDLAGQEYNTFLNKTTPNYTQNVMPEMARASAVSNTMQRTADVQDITNLGPLARMAMRNANPDTAALVDKLVQQGNEGLSAGAMLSGDELRNLNNSLRSSQGTRGISYGPSSSYEEALAASQFGQQLKQQRQQSALGALGASNAFYGDPFQQILGRGNQAFSSLGALGQQAGQGVQGAGPSLFNPNAANQLYAGWQQTVGQTNAANAGMTGSIIGGGLSALGSIGMGAMLCWSAREIFGTQTNRWKRFRRWMLDESPAKFRDWYLAHGAEWAERIRQRPNCRRAVQAWMERRMAMV